MKDIVTNSILELLYTNEKVSVPNLGTFSTYFKSATIDVENGKIYPPKKSIEFSNNVNYADNLLETYLINSHSELEDSAKNTIANFVTTIKKRLIGENSEINLKNLGTFKLIGSKIDFIANDVVNVEEYSYGLSSLNLPANAEKATIAESKVETTTSVKTESEVETTVEEPKEILATSINDKYTNDDKLDFKKEEVNENEQTIMQPPKLENVEDRSSRFPFWAIIIPIFICFLFGFFIWQMMYNRENVNPFAFGSKNEVVNEKLKEVGATELLKDQTTLSNNTEVTEEETTANAVETTSTKTETSATSTNASSNTVNSNNETWAPELEKEGKLGYYVVVGSVPNKTLAQKKVSDLRAFDQFDAYILPGPNGYNRIGIYTGEDAYKAETIKTQMQATLAKDAWIYRHK